ncbi:MAG: discoidin domain-containing protein [Candidatus Hadarchaeales archaeon]
MPKEKELKEKLSELAREMERVKVEKPVPAPPRRAPAFKTFLPLVIAAVAAGGGVAAWKLGLIGGGTGSEPVPGLQVTLVPPENVYVGRTYQITVTVRNTTNALFDDWIEINVPGRQPERRRVRLAPKQSENFLIDFTPTKAGAVKISVAGYVKNITVSPPPAPKFRVKWLTAAPQSVNLDPDVSPTATLEVVAEVTNEGGQVLDEDALLYVGPSGFEECVGSQRVRLGPGENQVLRFSYTLTADVLGEAEEGTALDVNVMLGSETTTIQVTGHAKFETELLEVKPFASGPEGELLIGDNVLIIFRLKNTGTAGGSHTVRLTIGGLDVDSKSYRLKRGESVRDNFRWVPSYKGTFKIEVDEQAWSEDLEVKRPAQLKLLEVKITPSNPLTLEPFTVTARVQNLGDVRGRGWVKLRVTREGGTTVENVQRVEVAAGEAESVQLEGVANSSYGSMPVRVELRRDNDNVLVDNKELSVAITANFRFFSTSDRWVYSCGEGTRTDQYLGRQSVEWHENQFDVIRGIATSYLYRYYLQTQDAIYWAGESRSGSVPKYVRLRSPLLLFNWPWLDIGGNTLAREILYQKPVSGRSFPDKIWGGILFPSSAQASSQDGEILVGENWGTSQADNGYIYAVRFQVPRSWSVTSIGLAGTSANGFGWVAIYTDNGGQPGTLVVQNTAKQAMSAGWTDFSISATLDPGTYWLAFWLSAGNTLCRKLETDAGRRVFYPGDYQSFTFPENFPVESAQSIGIVWYMRVREGTIYESGLSIDKKTETQWRSLPAQPARITWDLGSVRGVDGLRINWPTDSAWRPASYWIEVSPDGTTWENVVTSSTSPPEGWKEYRWQLRNLRYIRVVSGSQMGTNEVEYYCPLSVSLTVDPLSVRFENVGNFGSCVVFYYTLKIDGYGRVWGQASALMGALTYDFVDVPATVHMERRGTMWYSRRYGLVKEAIDSEVWTNDPLSWYMGSFSLNLSESDTVTLQSTNFQ